VIEEGLVFAEFLVIRIRNKRKTTNEERGNP